MVIYKTTHSLLIKVEVAFGVLCEQFAATVTEKFVIGHLQFECFALPLVVQVQVISGNEGHFLIGSFSSENVGQRDVFEPDLFSDLVVAELGQC
jgi:hypothetical protein